MANCDFQALLSAAKCAGCYDSHQLRMIIAQLLCDIEGDLSGGALGGLVLAPWQHDTPSQALVNHSSPGGGFTILGSLTGINTGPDQYIFLYDDATFPPVIAPFDFVLAFSGTTFNFDYGDAGVKCPNGILAVNSTTVPGYTAGAADCWFNFKVRP